MNLKFFYKPGNNFAIFKPIPFKNDIQSVSGKNQIGSIENKKCFFSNKSYECYVEDKVEDKNDIKPNKRKDKK